MLDLDKFASFIALELLMRHLDGYAMAKNNYWIYHDPTSKKAVFLPHGMDQIFWQPQGSLFPTIEGVLAQGFLETQSGRKEFRERCANLFTNHFLRLTNRLSDLQTHVAPLFRPLGTNAVRQQTRAVASLQERIASRLAHMRRYLFESSSERIVLKSGESIPLTNWLANVERGKVNFGEISRSDGQRTLQVQIHPQEEPASVLWEKSVLLPAGVYRVSAYITADRPVFRGAAIPVTLGIWGLSEVELESQIQDAQHLQHLTCSFALSTSQPENLLIQCHVTGQDERLTYQLNSTQFTRLD